MVHGGQGWPGVSEGIPRHFRDTATHTPHHAVEVWSCTRLIAGSHEHPRSACWWIDSVAGADVSTIRRSVSKLPNGRWRARYVDPFTGAWASAGAHRTKTEAHGAIDTIVAGVHAGVHTPAERSSMTFGEYATEVFFPVDAVAAQTRQQQDRSYRSLVEPRWGNVTLRDVDIADVERWARIELPATKLKTRTGTIGVSQQQQAYWLFHKIMVKAVERNYVTRSPLPTRSGLERHQASKPKNILDPAGVDRLAAATTNEAALIYAMAYGGFRCGETFALRVDDLDFAHSEISVDEQVIYRAGSARIEPVLKRPRSHRSVPMPRLVMEMLAEHVMRKTLDHTDALLWPNSVGGPRDVDLWRRRSFHPALVRSGLPRMVPHELRHTAASAWFDEGFDLVEVARMLGDSLAVAERTYIHLYKGRRPERMTALDARVRRGQADNVIPLRQATTA